jgi:hypothetical protein
MSDSDDLLGKTDAFLKRYRPSAAPAPDNIPVLTEVVSVAPVQSGSDGSAEKPPDSQLTKTELREFEQKLIRVFKAIDPYVAEVLGEPMRVRMEEHLRGMLAALTAEAKADIDNMIREAVARAIQEEIARLRKTSQQDRA